MINVTNTPNPETKKLNIDFEISDGSKEFTPDDHGGIKLVKDLLRERFFTTSNLLRAAVRKYPKELPYPKIKISDDAKSDFV